MNMPSLLKNKYIFYGLLTLEILSIISYIYAREYKCLVLLILTSYSAYCKFNNNDLKPKSIVAPSGARYNI